MNDDIISNIDIETQEDTPNQENTEDSSNFSCDLAEENILSDEDEKGSEFETLLDDYLPTPENTSKVKKPFPKWMYSVIASAVTCIVFLTVYSVAVFPSLRPHTYISYTSSDSESSDANAKIPGNVYTDSMNAIVAVESTVTYHSFFGVSTADNSGTGIVLSKDGYILTSASLAGSDNAKVTLPDGKEFSAKTVGVDSGKDIAIVKIEAENLATLKLGDSNNVNPGDDVIVIGNILGKNFNSTVTRGIICGINNNITLSNGQSVNLLQTDALTGEGSSGSCVLNSQGDIIGMITSSISSNIEGISFAIPSNDIMKIAESLITTGDAPQQLIIGITGSDSDHGVIVDSVIDDSPASKSDIKIGDLILKVDNTPVKSIAEINKIRDSHRKGDKITITIYREGNIIDMEVTL